MSQRSDKPRTIADSLAGTVESWRGLGSTVAEALRELGAVDRAVYLAVAETSTPQLDGPARRLSNAANYSRLWLATAGVIAAVGGRRGSWVAAEGVLAIGTTSALVNLGVKPLVRRRRPDRQDPPPFEGRYVAMPQSPSFPSGHAASGFAFAYAVSRHLPGLAVPIRVLAAAVAYSRVHTGVHYPGDVVLGSVIGAGTAAMVAEAWDHIAANRSIEPD